MDPRLEELRFASGAWESRISPGRETIDVLCLVPDVPTFLEAISSWDTRHAFPILIDEPEMVLKFQRAFRPSRIVRYPRRASPIADGKLWDEALNAAGRSFAAKGRGKGAPGVVVSEPGSPSLAGAVALAAGRFQPLLRWEPGRKRADVPTTPEAEALALDLENKVAALVPNSRRLGDDCDFLTLAGDSPERYDAVQGKAAQAGVAALDDLIGRTPDRAHRWAFTGRLGGDAAVSVYRAMCSLFLQPREALLFNGYQLDGEPWGGYQMASAARRLEREGLEVTHLAGAERATLAGWHRATDPVSRFGLLSINTHGSPTVFNIQGGAGQTADLPWTVPAAVLMIHSFSAADPSDPSTLAGRWLANGAFVYFGSLNEPFLSAFRTPTLQADLIAEGLPFAAVARISSAESVPFGHPWRLHYVGDPLYHLARAPARLPSWKPIEGWPIETPGPPRPSETSPAAVVAWAYRQSLAPVPTSSKEEVAKRLLAVRREMIEAGARTRFDAILVDALISAGRLNDIRERLGQVSPSDSTPDIRRWLETARMVQLQADLAAGRFEAAGSIWAELVRSRSSPEELKTMVTARLSARATTPALRRDWLRRLKSTREDLGPKSSFLGEIDKEIGRVQAALK